MGNFWAGVGASLTFGATDWIREQLGVNEVVHKGCLAYRAGEYTELVAELSLAGVSKVLTRMAVRNYQRARNAAKTIVKALRMGNREHIVHHVNPLLGHPGGQRTLFPTAGLPPKVHSGRWNLQVLDKEAHKRAHRRLRRVEQVLRINTNRYTISARFLNNLHRDSVQGCEE
ncbi:MAG: hypothetical protein WHX60_07625 [Armatimonadota bacterium]